MSQDTILIIGGGVIGVCSAYFLSQRGAQVTLVEQGEIAAGASYGNAGFIVPSHCIPLASPGALGEGLRWLLDPESPFYIKPRPDASLIGWLWRFALTANASHLQRALPVMRDLGQASRQLYDELAALDGLKFHFERRGMLYVYRSRGGFKEGQEEAGMLEAAGLVVQVLKGAQAREMEPTLRPEVIGAIYFPNDAHLNPAEFVQGLAGVAERNGVAIRTKTEVLGFEMSDGKIAKVRTTRGDFQPEQVVLAAGAWSPLVARDLRLKIPIQAAKGYSLTYQRPDVCPTYPLLLVEARLGVTPLGPYLRFAGTLELAGLDFSINPRRVNAIRHSAQAHLKGMENLEIVEIWRGLRPCTPDGLPIIGRSARINNLIVAAGHATLGLSLGPVTGKLVAQVACGEKPEIDLRPLRAERF